MFHVHVQCFNSTTWVISMYYIYLLHVYTDTLPDLPSTEVPQPTNKAQDKKSTKEEVISGLPVAYNSPIPSEVLSESDDPLIYMGMEKSYSADVATANDVMILHKEDIQKQKPEETKKSEEQGATPVQEQVEGKAQQEVQHKQKPSLAQR